MLELQSLGRLWRLLLGCALVLFSWQDWLARTWRFLSFGLGTLFLIEAVLGRGLLLGREPTE